MLDAYSQEVFTDLITGRPSASFDISGGKSNEVGNTYSNDVTVTLTINPTGTYKYGAKDAEGNKEQADIAFTSLQTSGGILIRLESGDGEIILAYELSVDSSGINLYESTENKKY